jgi:hypothetical protein
MLFTFTAAGCITSNEQTTPQTNHVSAGEANAPLVVNETEEIPAPVATVITTEMSEQESVDSGDSDTITTITEDTATIPMPTPIPRVEPVTQLLVIPIEIKEAPHGFTRDDLKIEVYYTPVRGGPVGIFKVLTEISDEYTFKYIAIDFYGKRSVDKKEKVLRSCHLIKEFDARSWTISIPCPPTRVIATFNY